MSTQITSVTEAVRDLVGYGLRKKLITADDAVFAANGILDALKYEPAADFHCDAENAGKTPDLPLEEILAFLLDDAVARGVIPDGTASRDLLDTRLMGCMTPRPGEVIRTFRSLYDEDPEKATDYFYRLSLDSDYIRTYRIARNVKFPADTRYGKLDITINLSKPEKDPRAIAAALKRKQDVYPQCLLCRENEGYAGRLDHPARETIRLIPLTLGGAQWYMQYSPYVYYNEHCIVLSGEHIPMKIEKATFDRLLEFITIFPHYTIGSNADLPIVGGSILTHEHFQGGRYTFAMAKAGIRQKIAFRGYEDIDAGIVDWPMSVIRLDSDDPKRLSELADKILGAWRTYSDPSVEILAETDGTPHNTITPIARRRNADGTLYEGGDAKHCAARYELDLVLRNNRTTDEYPLGIFHPHQELHHIKKENIGLIEVMGLAVLPARLLNEMNTLEETILAGKDPARNEAVASHAAWAKEIILRHPEYAPEAVAARAATDADKDKLDEIIRQEIGQVFAKVLECCGVFKETPAGNAAFEKFIGSVE